MSDSLSESTTRAVPGQPRLRRALFWMIAYAIVVAVIVFWPEHVDKGMGSFLRTVMHYIPLVTPRRVEFGSNILLFVPLGILLAILMPRRRYLVAPIGFVVTLTIESVQGVLLGGRTASVSDLIANTAGTCIGLLAIEVVDALRRRSPVH